ncbi:hypothetical protein F4779DRAFT_630208 [Xylariaceae sp. FL0662B]|nr:hypothetical protein F4779DRAFT_630208 [Xylariaceae sp. FL0662B]
MGIHPELDLQRPSALLDTPELVSPSSSTYSSKVSEEPSWNISTTPVSPPMSNYDTSTRPEMSAGKGSEVGQFRRDIVHNPPRQQLPSLSSLFGPPHHVRPLYSPLSDRPSPLFDTHSPLDRPLSASTNPERPYSKSSSYFPNLSPPLTQPRRVYEPRVEPERLVLPSVAPQFPGPLSPPSREFEHSHYASRSEPVSNGKWSHSGILESRRPEYVFGPRPSTPSFRPTGERMALPPLSQSLGREPGAPVKNESKMHLGLPNHSPTSASPLTPEGAPVKDGLGPKIWTGTHFLPRFVRQAEVPGEGLCYFYDDGTHCKTIIDGEPVNAHWGVTKAGKPRKRLAIACLTCREKKIKCDPDYPRCVQCEKFGRICKFKNAPRGGHNSSPVTSPAEHEEPRQLASQKGNEFGRPRSASTTSASPRPSKASHSSPEILSGLPAKRMKYTHEPYPPQPTSRPSPLIQGPEIKTTASSSSSSSSLSPWQPRDLPRIHEDILYRPWHPDPYVSTPSAMITTLF